MTTRKIVKKLGLVIFVINLTLTIPSKSFAQDKDFGKHWRPRSHPEVPKDGISKKKMEEIIQGLQFQGKDSESLLLISLADGHRAAQVVKQYLETNIAQKLPRNKDWGTAVYCLGLIKDPDAKNYLLELWKHYDTGIASGSIELKPSDITTNMWPLEPIEDSIEFYSPDEDVRQWMRERIKESENLSNSFTGIYRKTVRQHFLSCEYRIDIVESFRSDPSNSITNLVKHISLLPSLVGSETEKEYLAKRDYKDHRLEAILLPLGKNLSITLWSRCLKKGTDAKPALKCRLFLMATFCHLRDVESNRLFEITGDDESQWLADAIGYFKSLPKSRPRELGIGGLYKMWLYNPRDEGLYKDIKELADLLPDAMRKTLQNAVKR